MDEANTHEATPLLHDDNKELAAAIAGAPWPPGPSDAPPTAATAAAPPTAGEEFYVVMMEEMEETEEAIADREAAEDEAQILVAEKMLVRLVKHCTSYFAADTKTDKEYVQALLKCEMHTQPDFFVFVVDALFYKAKKHEVKVTYEEAVNTPLEFVAKMSLVKEYKDDRLPPKRATYEKVHHLHLHLYLHLDHHHHHVTLSSTPNPQAGHPGAVPSAHAPREHEELDDRHRRPGASLHPVHGGAP